MAKGDVFRCLLRHGALTESQLAKEVCGDERKIANISRALDTLEGEGLIVQIKVERSKARAKKGPLPTLCALNMTKEGRSKLEEHLGLEDAIFYLRRLNETELLELVKRYPGLDTVAYLINTRGGEEAKVVPKTKSEIRRLFGDVGKKADSRVG